VVGRASGAGTDVGATAGWHLLQRDNRLPSTRARTASAARFMLPDAGRMWGCAPGLGALPIELPPGRPRWTGLEPATSPLEVVTGTASTRPAPWQHDEPTAEHHGGTTGNRIRLLTALQAASHHQRDSCHARAQDDSNVRLLLRRKPCCPLHYEPRALPAGLEPAISSSGNWRPIHWTMEAWCAGMDSNHRARGTWFTARRNRPLCHRRSGCPTGFEPVKAWLTTKSLSHLGQGTSRPGRFRTCDLRRVKAALPKLSYRPFALPGGLEPPTTNS
jgi:hypothetical protein